VLDVRLVTASDTSKILEVTSRRLL